MTNPAFGYLSPSIGLVRLYTNSGSKKSGGRKVPGRTELLAHFYSWLEEREAGPGLWTAAWPERERTGPSFGLADFVSWNDSGLFAKEIEKFFVERKALGRKRLANWDLRKAWQRKIILDTPKWGPFLCFRHQLPSGPYPTHHHSSLLKKEEEHIYLEDRLKLYLSNFQSLNRL